MEKIETYNIRECDYDSEKAEKLFGNKTAEELDKMVEEWKEKFLKEHPEIQEEQ